MWRQKILTDSWRAGICALALSEETVGLLRASPRLKITRAAESEQTKRAAAVRSDFWRRRFTLRALKEVQRVFCWSRYEEEASRRWGQQKRLLSNRGPSQLARFLLLCEV